MLVSSSSEYDSSRVDNSISNESHLLLPCHPHFQTHNAADGLRRGKKKKVLKVQLKSNLSPGIISYDDDGESLRREKRTNLPSTATAARVLKRERGDNKYELGAQIKKKKSSNMCTRS